jgi:hypothetical protein
MKLAVLDKKKSSHLSELFQKLLDLLLREVCIAEMQGLFELELFAQLRRLPGPNVENAREGERMSALTQHKYLV